MAFATPKRILVTGGTGYIGSHMVQVLLRRSLAVTVLDDCSRGHQEVIDLLRSEAASESRPCDLAFERCCVSETERIRDLVRAREIDSVIHFAALAYVGESVERPLDYWRTNLGGTLSLLAAIEGTSVARFVFSSTCATYGVPEPSLIPIREGCPQHPINPYGAAKAAAERAIADFHAAQTARGISLACAVLRYFNVIGCDPRGVLGEDHDPETHLVPSALAAALGRRRELVVMGTDYPTPDGTCVRDYVDVTDLCEAHWAALSALTPRAHETFNVGTGIGHSVLEVLAACERVALTRVPSSRGARRPGDPPLLVADSSLIQRRLAWAPRVTSLDDSIASIWRWMRANPRGYA